jgi:hypothetical protein
MNAGISWFLAEKVAQLAKAGIVLGALDSRPSHDHMVHDFNLQKLARSNQVARNTNICIAGGAISRRMKMD